MFNNQLFTWFICFNILYYESIKRILHIKKESKRAYILSVLNSFVLSIYGIVYNLAMYFDVLDNLYTDEIITFFQSYLLCDLIIGYSDYHHQILGIEGVCHHILYMFFNILAFYRPIDKTYYLLYTIEEIPTFIRGFGYINSNYRSNMLFGIKMILWRVLYHIYLLYTFASFETWVVTLLSALTLSVHLNWTYRWIIKYGLKLKSS